MTDQLDYTSWTWQQHLTKAAELAAQADQFGDNLIASKAAQRGADVQQITARGWLHAKLAELKKAETVSEAQLEDAVAVAPEPEAQTATTDVATTRATRRNRSRGA